VIAAFTDDPVNAEIDIAECAATQVLIERTIQLRHQAHLADAGTLCGLEKLVRHENRLIHRRNSLLNLVDTDDYAQADSSTGADTV
jgi:hypothetical protein